MRKLVFLFATGSLLFLFNNSNAQSETSNVITANVGFSLVGNIFNVPNAAVAGDVGSYSIPALQLGFDHYMNNWFSMGIAGSFQQMGIKYDQYQNMDGTVVDGDLKIVRINLAARVLFHYANKDRFDIFSGLRLGFTNWNVNEDFITLNGTYDYTDVFDFSGTNFAPQVILFGVRGYFTDNIGANMELSVGAPYYFSLGLNYKL